MSPVTTVLVTGGTGFIGSYVAQELERRMGYRPLVLDRSRHSEIGNLVLGDIRDATAVNEAMAHADGWIHLAGVLGTAETIQNPLPAAETNVIGGLNVLQAAAQYRLPGVCIAVGNHWMNNTYSITKTTIERFCAMYRAERGLPVTVVRALNAYGPRQSVAAPFGPSKVRKIMPALVCRALLGLDIELYGDGSQVMDMIYVEDVARILVDALERTMIRGPIERVLEAGTGRATTVLDIAQTVASEVGEANLKFLPMRPGEPEHSIVIADVSTLRNLYTHMPEPVKLEDGVQRTVEWFRKHWLSAYQETR